MAKLGQFILILICASLVAVAGSQETTTLAGLPLFGLCAILAFLIQWLVFIPSFLAQTEHYFDLTGALTYLSLVAVSLFFGSPSKVSILIGLLISIWAIRLGSFLFRRVRMAKRDSRFENKDQFGWFIVVWTLQGLWVFLTSAAGICAISVSTQGEFGVLSALGLLLWVLGFGIEIIADHQKSSFRALAENKGRFITSGLWAYSRHPNYLGEILLWLGIAVIASPVLTGWQRICFISPIFVWFLLKYVSGVPLLEAQARARWGTEVEYNNYVNTTPVLFPKFSSKDMQKKRI